MTKYRLDGYNGDASCASLEEAIQSAAGWYEFLDDEWQFPQFQNLDMTKCPKLNQEGIETLEDLQAAVSDWEERLAEFYGFSSYSTGVNSFPVSARNAADFDLCITEEEDEEQLVQETLFS